MSHRFATTSSRVPINMTQKTQTKKTAIPAYSYANVINQPIIAIMADNLKTIERVLVLMAMEQEARPFIQKHGLKPVPIPGAPDTVVSHSRSKVPYTYPMSLLSPRPLLTPPCLYVAVARSAINFDCAQPFKAYCGQLSNSSVEVVLVWAGSDPRFLVNNVATTASTASAYASILGFQPDLVLSAGTAGGFSSTSTIGVRMTHAWVRVIELIPTILIGPSSSP